MQKPDPRSISTAPGVYLFGNEKGVTIYVGKAKNLRKRVLSYFRNNVASKTAAMLAHACSLKTLVTATEKEALLLEASLIKKHRPRYNIVLRDDKDHILFRIDTAADFPRLEIVRRVRPGRGMAGKVLFGPFSSTGAARETWRAIHKVFPLRRCPDRSFGNRTRPCLYHHMGQCLGPCVLDVDKEQYAAAVRQVILLLRGKSGELLELLEKEMLAAAESLDFEHAAVLRDRIRAVKQTVERQAVVLDVSRDMDVMGVAALDGGLALCILFVRGGVLLDKKTYFWPDLVLDDAPELLESFLVQFYQTGLPVPPRIVASWFGAAGAMADTAPDAGPGAGEDAREGAPGGGIGDAGGAGGSGNTEALAAALGDLRGGPVHLLPPRGRDEEALVAMAAANAGEMRRQPDALPMAGLLETALHAARPVERIEAVDVSHTGGSETRVGMVVFAGERPEKDAYRAYAVDAGGDDYAALYQWAKRRAAAGEPWPDLVLVDGGKGQLAAVVRGFAEAGITDAFAVAGIAKARTEDGRADRRAGNDADRIFLPARSNPLPIAPGSPELFFLQHVRDTVHDFAIGRHRKARANRAMAGELLRIPGVGPKIAKILWQHFGSLTAMAETDAATLAAIPGIGPRLAEKLVNSLQSRVKTS
ncbi:UvrABC system protein C [uncultured delta proteobacterium]|uniref:UvrABC system protein C n=1 Tax=uncultured delta proteobacterium TaxID=34034 RepID=A0A212KDE7_9DELT|nr:UvrABC system protein C [uncultured delta proteobacterium]